MASSVNHRVIIIVFFSCGGFILLACAAVALYYFLNTKKKVQETDLHVDEHRKVKEAIVSGPNGPHAVIIGIEDDIHVTEDIVKAEKVERGSRLGALETGATSSSSDHRHQMEHKA
ncbi:hypothetical protein GQ457_01G012610 [Hibiscus cannabinus]